MKLLSGQTRLSIRRYRIMSILQTDDVYLLSKIKYSWMSYSRAGRSSMHSKHHEIVVLKPTTVFLSFLASQLPELDVPNLKQLHTDTTAYVIAKKDSDEGTLNEIARHFSTMFRHEICRWLGDSARNEIENSFIDFLCCFKFELHNHIILMESDINQGQQLLTIKPRTVLLNWMKTAAEDADELNDIMEQVTLSHITENATVLVKNFPKLSEIKPFVSTNYKPLFETAMSRMSGDKQQWPQIHSFSEFSKYFAIEIHTQLIHLYK